MDCSVRPTRYADLFVITTTDFFYPLVDDPYMQGKIACANVLSDLYAMGVVECDNLLMLLAASRDMSEIEREICTKLIMKGFNDQAASANTCVTGGQSVMNPWPIIGGVAISTCKTEDFITPDNCQIGDKLVLTKPIGTQVVVNLHQWRTTQPDRMNKVSHIISEEEAISAYEYSIDLMVHLNRTAAQLMHKYKAHAATDVTGFGLLGHARNLVRNQKRSLDFTINTIPIIKKMAAVAELFPFFKLRDGLSAETSGGLLISLPPHNAEQFCEEFYQLEGYQSWVIGEVVTPQNNSQNQAFIEPSASIIEVGYPVPAPSMC